jgi:hypothetical protein
MKLIGDKKLDLFILGSVVSTSGKYKIFYGQHYGKGVNCYDVGSTNLRTGETTRRHYLSKEEAIRFYDEFRTRMTEKAKPEETDERDRYEIN